MLAVGNYVLANAAKPGVDVVGSPTGRLLEGAGRTLCNTDDVEPVDDDLDGGGTIVEEDCTCNDEMATDPTSIATTGSRVLYATWRTRCGIRLVADTTRYILRGVQEECMSREREDTGRYTETVALEDVLRTFDEVDGPVVTSGDVAETLDCSRETARRKLATLEEQGRIASRKTAGRVVWWIIDSREEANDVNPEDPFWEVEPGASGETTVSENVDEVLYGDS